MARFFRKIQTSDSDLMKMQDALAQVLNPTLKFPLLEGVQINNIDITTAGVDIPHGLGRIPQGWFLTDNNANSVIWKTAATDLLLSLDASATATISVFIY